ncbi:MAG: hypothetical protein U9O87_07275 [Verrucomicrobiota bacterium]|nr:hypothetical protein [Verrucomicrobiota bacterium]
MGLLDKAKKISIDKAEDSKKQEKVFSEKIKDEPEKIKDNSKKTQEKEKTEKSSSKTKKVDKKEDAKGSQKEKTLKKGDGKIRTKPKREGGKAEDSKKQKKVSLEKIKNEKKDSAKNASLKQVTKKVEKIKDEPEKIKKNSKKTQEKEKKKDTDKKSPEKKKKTEKSSSKTKKVDKKEDAKGSQKEKTLKKGKGKTRTKPRGGYQKKIPKKRNISPTKKTLSKKTPTKELSDKVKTHTILNQKGEDGFTHKQRIDQKVHQDTKKIKIIFYIIAPILLVLIGFFVFAGKGCSSSKKKSSRKSIPSFKLKKNEDGSLVRKNGKKKAKSALTSLSKTRKNRKINIFKKNPVYQKVKKEIQPFLLDPTQENLSKANKLLNEALKAAPEMSEKLNILKNKLKMYGFDPSKEMFEKRKNHSKKN